jgi:hypothetical protein
VRAARGPPADHAIFRSKLIAELHRQIGKGGSQERRLTLDGGGAKGRRPAVRLDSLNDANPPDRPARPAGIICAQLMKPPVNGGVPTDDC